MRRYYGVLKTVAGAIVFISEYGRYENEESCLMEKADALRIADKHNGTIIVWSESGAQLYSREDWKDIK